MDTYEEDSVEGFHEMKQQILLTLLQGVAHIANDKDVDTYEDVKGSEAPPKFS